MTAGTLAERKANNLGYWCADAVRRDPRAIAMIDLCGATPREVGYGEFDARADRFAALIAGLGVKPGDRMAMAIGNRFEFVEVMYGAMRAGIVPVPLNTKLGADTLDYIVRNAGCVAAVVEPSACPALVGVVDKIGLPTKLALDPAP